jgi:hypothetical protein
MGARFKNLIGDKDDSSSTQPPSLEKAATFFADALIAIAKKVAPPFKRALTTASSLSPELVIPQVEAEVCALYLHLYRRNAFRKLGVDRDWFLDELRGHVASRLPPIISLEAFSVLCSEIDREYSAYKEIPDKPEDGPRGTVFWEFGKRLGFKYQGYNPIALHLFMIEVIEQYIALVEVIKGS